jgi:hypothetical protein
MPPLLLPGRRVVTDRMPVICWQAVENDDAPVNRELFRTTEAISLLMYGNLASRYI